MLRPQSFWDVLANTADYAAEVIPKWQKQKREVARQGIVDRRYNDQQTATANYRNEQLGIQRGQLDVSRERLAFDKSKPHPTEHSSFDQVYADILTNPGKYPPQVVKDFKEAAAERHPGKAEKETPDFLGLGRTALQSATDRWRAGKANRVVGRKDGEVIYGPDPYFNEPEPTWTTPGAGGGPSIIQSLRSQAEKYGQDPDELEYQLSGKYPAAGLLKQLGVTNVPRLNYAPSRSPQPTRGITPYRSEAGGMNEVGRQGQDWESVGRQNFEDWDTLTPQEKAAVIQKMQREGI